jgi:hypothetical protein
MHRHPNIAAWQREEDGSYKSEVDGFAVHVVWRPESRDASVPRGFLWKVEGPNGEKAEAAEVIEEIEIAMSLGEDAARHAASAASDHADDTH